jgi:hypothetical protein
LTERRRKFSPVAPEFAVPKTRATTALPRGHPGSIPLTTARCKRLSLVAEHAEAVGTGPEVDAHDAVAVVDSDPPTERSDGGRESRDFVVAILVDQPSVTLNADELAMDIQQGAAPCLLGDLGLVGRVEYLDPVHGVTRRVEHARLGRWDGIGTFGASVHD